MTHVYHFTDTFRLPWIIETGELRIGRNQTSGLPFDFLWATTNPAGDRSSSVQGSLGRESYRRGLSQLVRFTLPEDGFIKWSDVQQFPEWTTQHVARTQKAAIECGETGFDNWRLRRTALPLTSALAVEAKSYTTGRWTPIDATMKSRVILADIDNGRGVIVGERVYLSQQVVVPSGAVGYVPLGITSADTVKAAAATFRDLAWSEAAGA